MVGNFLKASMVAMTLAAVAVFPEIAAADTLPRPQVPRDTVYVVYYRNFKQNGPWRVYGMYSSWAQANRATNFVNSFPAYMGYFVSR
jgi:hypothetical protein